jgi:hypothetical protein
MDAITATPVADQLAKARADLANATTAAKLATAKRARLAAEVRALEAEAEIEAMRIQARADRERAEAAEVRAEAADAALAAERAAHLAEEREHAAEVERLKTRAPAPKRATGRKDGAANGSTADPGNRSGTAAPLAIVPDAAEPPARPDAGANKPPDSLPPQSP